MINIPDIQKVIYIGEKRTYHFPGFQVMEICSKTCINQGICIGGQLRIIGTVDIMPCPVFCDSVSEKGTSTYMNRVVFNRNFQVCGIADDRAYTL